MTFGQVIEDSKINIFFQESCRKWGRETTSRPLSVFQKSFIWGKGKWSAAYYQYISIVHSFAYNKNKLYKTLEYSSKEMLDFDFWEKGLGIVSPPHFVYDFAGKMFLVLISMRHYLIILLREILFNMCIAIVC